MQEEARGTETIMIGEALIAGIVSAMGEFAVTKATDLVKSLGQEAWDALARVVNFTTGRLLEKGGSAATVVSEFQKDPATFAKPLAKMVSAECAADPGFAEALTKLVETYNAKVEARGVDVRLRIEPNRDFIAVGSVVGSGGSVSTAGDIVGGSKYVRKVT